MIRHAGALIRPGVISAWMLTGTLGLAAPRIEGVAVRTSVGHKTITVNVQMSGVTATGRARMTGQVTDATGRLVLTLDADLPVSATPFQVVQISAAWHAANLWAPNAPVLYRLEVRAAGEGWTASRGTRFGFREFGVHGREFVLNGRSIRLRGLSPEPGAFDGTDVRRAVAAGFNTLVWTRSAPGADVLDAADVSGILIVCPPDGDPATRSHPSVVMWSIGNPERESTLSHPMRIGRSGSQVPASTRMVVDGIRSADPTRPIMSFDGGGDAQMVAPDLARVSFQERDEWMSAWGTDGVRPVLAVVAFDAEPDVTKRMLRGWRLAGPVSVALPSSGTSWPAAPPVHDGWIAGPTGERDARDHLFHVGETVHKTVVVVNDGPDDVPYAMRWTLDVGRKVVIGGGHGETIPAGSMQSFAAEGTLPAEVFGFPSGAIGLEVTIAATTFTESFPLRVFPRPVPGSTGHTAFAVDPEGATSAWLRALGWTLKPWSGQPMPGRIVVIGRKALDKKSAPGSIAAHVAAGGRALIMAQSPARLRRAGFTVAETVERRMWPVPAQSDLPLLAAVDGEMLRDWRGFGTLVPDTSQPDSAVRHWGNRGSVCSAPLVAPAGSGWIPVIEGGPDRTCAGLMEIHFGRGFAILCTLDLEGRVGVEPAANHLATRLMDRVRDAPVRPGAPTAVADRDNLDLRSPGGRRARKP